MFATSKHVFKIKTNVITPLKITICFLLSRPFGSNNNDNDNDNDKDKDNKNKNDNDNDNS